MNRSQTQIYYHFWIQYPALFYGITFLLGIYAKYQSYYSCVALSVLNVPFLINLKSLKISSTPILSLVIFASGFLYCDSCLHYPPIPQEGLEGTALFQISNFTKQNTISGSKWQYKGKLLSFKPKVAHLKSFSHIPVTLNIANNPLRKRPPADQDYVVEGKLLQSETGKYIFLPSKSDEWLPVGLGNFLLEWRFGAKQAVSSFIRKKIPNETSAHFLAGLTTGDFENSLMVYELSRFGLQHIMAISGFHFSIIAGILGSLFTMLFKNRMGHIFLILVLTAYFIFLGPSPSIIRAWISILIVSGSIFLEKKASSINSLGIGLLVALITNPEFALHMGFQFSFAITAAILLLYPTIDHRLQLLFPSRKLEQTQSMNVLNQHGYIALVLLRQALALTLTVNLVALPLSLYYFQKFPTLGIIYNLFFPWMVSISIVLLLLGLPFDLLGSVNNWIHTFNGQWTQFVLDYTYGLSTRYDLYLNLGLSMGPLILFLSSTLIMGIYFRETSKIDKIPWKIV